MTDFLAAIDQESIVRRFWEKVERRSEQECWPWTGAKTSAGYGALWPGLKAHRVAYELSVGPVPAGLVLDHLCRTRSCVNPAHLEPVTDRENVARGLGPTGRLAAARVRSRQTCLRGHPFDEANTMLWRDGARRCRECNRKSSREYQRRLRLKRRAS